jgi:hypothetical protein
MNLDNLRKRAIDYTTDRLCRGGGFCFYRLEEPNGADTYYALSILSLMGIDFRDLNTVHYLKQMQREDGSYESIFAAFYSLHSLTLLRDKPFFDPASYIINRLHGYSFDVERLPAEITSIYKRLFYLVDLYCIYDNGRDRNMENDLIRFILRFRNNDYGFGYPRSTLTDTAYALTILSRLSYPMKKLCAEIFLKKCEIPGFGFTDIPGSSLSYIEYIYAGVAASRIAGYRPEHFKECNDFIVNCQNRNGGFARAMHSGIATLENTFHAIHALKYLEAILEN